MEGDRSRSQSLLMEDEFDLDLKDDLLEEPREISS
jgi:hypothetical protein